MSAPLTPNIPRSGDGDPDMTTPQTDLTKRLAVAAQAMVPRAALEKIRAMVAAAAGASHLTDGFSIGADGLPCRRQDVAETEADQLLGVIEAALAGAETPQGMVVRLPDLCDSAFVCLVCWQQIDVHEVWQEPPPQNHQEPVYTHAAKDGHPVARIDRWHRAAQPPPPAVDPPALVALVERMRHALDHEGPIAYGDACSAVMAWTPDAAAPPVAAPAVEGEIATKVRELLKMLEHSVPLPEGQHHAITFNRYGSDDAGWVDRLGLHVRTAAGVSTFFLGDADFLRPVAEVVAEVVAKLPPLASGSAPAARPAVEVGDVVYWLSKRYGDTRSATVDAGLLRWVNEMLRDSSIHRIERSGVIIWRREG